MNPLNLIDYMNIALVTGAANGLGKAYAIELAKSGYHTLLLDLPQTGLESLCNKIVNEFGTQSVFYEIDLTQTKQIIEVCQKINEQYEVSILINNAGIGGTRRFDEVDSDYLNTMMQLNIKAPTLLTKLLVPNLQKQTKAFVLNVSSMAAFSPMPYKTIYPASKSYLLSFTRSLQEEYRSSTICFSVVTPGPMNTNPEVSERINKQSKAARMSLLAPEKVAEISLRGLFNGKKLILLNGPNRFNYILMHIIPLNIRMYLLGKIMKRELSSNTK